MRWRSVILSVVFLLVISIVVVLYFSGNRDSRSDPDDVSSLSFSEDPEGHEHEESLAGILEALTEHESDYPSNPVTYLRAFRDHIVRAPEDTSFFRRVINFLMAVRRQTS